MAVLRIELLEDCEMNTGRLVNSLFSDDVFFDGFGLPFIPAWVIRNSLVKTIEDGKVEIPDGAVEALVGTHASLMIDDATVADRESMRQAILASPFGEILLRNPQTVLNGSGFTRIKKTFVLNANTYIRMLVKGTMFESYLEVDESHLDALRTLVAHTHALFVGHYVPARFVLDETWERPRFDAPTPEADWGGDRVRLEYDLQVVSHVTVFDHVSGEFQSKPYVAGEEIRDALMRREGLAGALDGAGGCVRCSNAYIKVNDRRGLPIPASWSTKKQDKNDLRDRCSRGRRPKDYDQIKGLGTLFIDDPDNNEVNSMSVRKEQAFVQYYQDGAFRTVPYCAIAQAQTFSGFIEGPADVVRRVFDSLTADGNVRVGHFSNLGFGNAHLQVTCVKPLPARWPVFVEEATVLLASPARLYRDGLYEASAQNVLNEIQTRLGGDVELEIVRNSQKTCLVSTYNSQWHELEPLEYAMQAGSIYRIRAKDRSDFDIAPVMGGIFIGGHNDEGYGETWVFPAVDAYYRHITYGDMPEGSFPLSFKADPNAGRRLMRSLYQFNANVMASQLGTMRAESFANEDFRADALSKIQSRVSEDFDVEKAFEAYIDSLKEAGLNAIRRGYRA